MGVSLSNTSRDSYVKCAYRPSCYEWASVSRSRARPPRVVPQLSHKEKLAYECIVWHACICCATILTVWKTVCHRGKDVSMAPAPGRLGGDVKMPVQVRMFPEEMAVVDAFAAELSQQSYGAAFSRAEALRIAAMEWLKERQARRASVPPAP